MVVRRLRVSKDQDASKDHDTQRRLEVRANEIVENFNFLVPGTFG